MSEIDKDHLAELVRKCQEGDNDAFGEIYDLLLTPIYRYVYYKVQNQEVAEDITEEVFLKAWKYIQRYKDQSYSFGSWLYRIAHNVTMDYFRKEEPLLEIQEEFLDVQKGNHPQKKVENFYQEKEIQKALLCLSENQKQVIVLKYINDLSYKEISEIMEKSELAIRLLHSRALKALRELLQELS